MGVGLRQFQGRYRSGCGLYEAVVGLVWFGVGTWMLGGLSSWGLLQGLCGDTEWTYEVNSSSKREDATLTFQDCLSLISIPNMH